MLRQIIPTRSFSLRFLLSIMSRLGPCSLDSQCSEATLTRLSPLAGESHLHVLTRPAFRSCPLLLVPVLKRDLGHFAPVEALDELRYIVRTNEVCHRYEKMLQSASYYRRSQETIRRKFCFYTFCLSNECRISTYKGSRFRYLFMEELSPSREKTSPSIHEDAESRVGWEHILQGKHTPHPSCSCCGKNIIELVLDAGGVPRS